MTGPVKRPANDALEYEHRRLVHELEVHRIELELQNQTLQETQVTLEESRAHYADLYDHSPIGHVTLDRAGLIRELNLATAAILGVERSGVIDKPLRMHVAPSSRGRLDAHLRAVFRSPRPARVELALKATSGEHRTVEIVSVSPGPSADSSVFHSAVIDVSERRRDESAREELLRREHDGRMLAEATNRAKKDFLAVVSHELRSPLAPMLMWVRALRAGGMSETLRKRAVDALEACVAVEVAMIEDLVDVAQGERGALGVELRRMDLGPVVLGAIEAAAPTAASKQIEVTVDVDAGPMWVLGDPRRLQQIVANLLANAFTFTPEAGHVSVSLRARDRGVVLTVSDDGEGIAAERLESIFDPFPSHGVHPPSHHLGLGLGLAIVSQLVTRLGGRVTAQSAGPGRGSCFTVTLAQP
jgi:PAS domain S-box-containing protein